MCCTSVGILDVVARRGAVRRRVLRTARAFPHLTAVQVARRVGCHASTAQKHLRTSKAGSSRAADATERPLFGSAAGSDTVLLARVSSGSVGVEDPLQSAACQAAAAEGCPPAVLARLARHGDSRVRVQAVLNPGCPAEALARACRDLDIAVRDAVANHNNTRCPPRAQMRAAMTVDAALGRRSDMAHVPAVASATSDPRAAVGGLWLAHDANYVEVLEHRRCPPQLLALTLVYEDDPGRWFAAAHPACPQWVLAQLASDPKDAVVRAAGDNQSAHPHTLRVFAGARNAVAREAAARNPNTEPDTLRRLAADNDEPVRRAVAGNPRCPPELLRQLATDGRWYVRRRVAGNPSCPRDVRRQLASDSQGLVSAVAASKRQRPAT